MKHPNLPESRSSSRITRPYLTSVTFFTRNNPSSIQQNANFGRFINCNSYFYFSVFIIFLFLLLLLLLLLFFIYFFFLFNLHRHLFIHQLWPSVVHLTYAIYWFAPSLKVPKVIHSAILPVLSNWFFFFFRKQGYNKNKKAQKITHTLAIFVDHGILAHIP